MFLRPNLLRLQIPRTQFLQQYLEARCYCDQKQGSEVSTTVKPKSSSLVREVRSEVAQIHATYRSEVLVKLESEEEQKDVSLSEGEGDTACICHSTVCFTKPVKLHQHNTSQTDVKPKLSFRFEIKIL